MVDLLGITCGGDGGGVNVIALISESCCRRRHKSSASVSYSSPLSLSKSVLNDIYCTLRLKGGASGFVSIIPVVVSNGQIEKLFLPWQETLPSPFVSANPSVPI